MILNHCGIDYDRKIFRVFYLFIKGLKKARVLSMFPPERPLTLFVFYINVSLCLIIIII